MVGYLLKGEVCICSRGEGIRGVPGKGVMESRGYATDFKTEDSFLQKPFL